MVSAVETDSCVGFISCVLFPIDGFVVLLFLPMSSAGVSGAMVSGVLRMHLVPRPGDSGRVAGVDGRFRGAWGSHGAMIGVMIAIPPRIAALGGVRAGTSGGGARSGGLRG